MPDFTIKSYQKLLEAFLNKEYTFLSLEDFIRQKSTKSIFLRHDVDRYTDRVEKFAKLENNLGIKSTFYFRPPEKSAHYKIIETVVKNQHDIGYHYNDLAENKGNQALALKSFVLMLSSMRQIADVKSICMHGNALSSVDNLDLWKNVDYRKYGVTGDPYFTIDHQKTLYITDTGRSWNQSRYSKWDKVITPFNYHPSTIKDIIADIENDSLPVFLHLCIHPQHYHHNPLKWTAYYFSQSLKNQVKAMMISRKRQEAGVKSIKN